MKKIKLERGACFLLHLLLVACAASMTPSELNRKLPNLTKSAYLEKAVSNEAVYQKLCTLLVSNRSYTAPVGFTVDGDLRNGAKGIDEWVEVDRGNAYTLNSFNWVTVDQVGSTQLTIYFNTYICEKEIPTKSLI
ncbi:MAG: hypothetical protein VXY23_03780 [Pseudomonadota bacterium]|nr:hypothetical protein [Pseudomonadota bacterium]